MACGWGEKGNQGFTYPSLPTRHYSPHWGLNPGPSVYRTDALPLSYRGCCGGGNCQSNCQLTALRLNQEPSWDSPYLINQCTLILEASAEPAISSLGERRLIFCWTKRTCQECLFEQGAWPRGMLRTNDGSPCGAARKRAVSKTVLQDLKTWPRKVVAHPCCMRSTYKTVPSTVECLGPPHHQTI